jgi:hypothetical protein
VNEVATIAKHQQDYKSQAWEQYTMGELGDWVHLLTKRAEHRSNPEKRAKDLGDARNYLAMMDAKLKAMEAAN